MRAALLTILSLVLALFVAGGAVAQVPDPVSPILIGPGPAVPPPPPALTDSHRGGKSHPGRKHGGNRAKPHRAKPKNGKGAKDKPGTSGKLHASCAPLGHTQTYDGWGPAVAYGTQVTVVYEASRCSTPAGEALNVSADGTATVFAGSSATGVPLDARPFTVTGTWRRPANAEAWPPSWWDCSVGYASYAWEIPGVYSFQVSARDGTWSLDVSSDGVGSQAVHWTHDGCA